MVKTQDGVKWARGPAWSGAACLYVSMWTNERQKGERAAHNESACARAWSDVPHQRAAGTGEERPSKQQKGASWVRSMALRLAGAWVNRGAHVGPRSKQRGAGCWGKQVVAWPSTRQQAKPLMGGRPCAAEEEACARAHVCQAPETEPHPHSTCIQSSRPFAHAHAHACICIHTHTNKETNKQNARTLRSADLLSQASDTARTHTHAHTHTHTHKALAHTSATMLTQSSHRHNTHAHTRTHTRTRTHKQKSRAHKRVTMLDQSNFRHSHTPAHLGKAPEARLLLIPHHVAREAQHQVTQAA